MSYFVMKSRKSPEVKADLLYMTMVSGRPWVANSFLRAGMVTCDDIVDKGTTSSHFE